MLTISLLICITTLSSGHSIYAQEDSGSEDKNSDELEKDKPRLKDPSLESELVFEGLKGATSMAFLDQDDILVLDRDMGTVQRIVNGELLQEPLLDISVTTGGERGMLGMAVAAKHNTTYVFLYLTLSSAREDGKDDCPQYWRCNQGNDPTVGNRVYRYELINNTLVNPKLLLDLPAWPGPTHNGGSIKIGPDNNLYVPIGDVHGQSSEETLTKAQNFKNGTNPDGRSGILRITQDGKPVNGSKGILGDYDPLYFYYAYGIRNSFGIDFDPVTGYLWDTENGPSFGDEINLVKPGFNSGWMQVQGVWKPVAPPNGDFIPGDEISNIDKQNSSDFGGKGEYSPPEFVWYDPVGPTAIKFLDTDKIGKLYQYDMFVGDAGGKIYHFELNNERTSLSLDGDLQDNIANQSDELTEVIFGQGFDGPITDIEVGPSNGYLYIVTLNGDIFKIVRSID